MPKTVVALFVLVTSSTIFAHALHSPVGVPNDVGHFVQREKLKFDDFDDVTERCKLHRPLIDTLRASHRLLLISLENSRNINVDGVAGIRSMASQLDVLRREMASRISSQFSPEVVVTLGDDIGYLINLARLVCDIAIGELEKQGTEYLMKMWTILGDNYWRLDYPSRTTDSALIYSNRTLINDMVEERLDNCFADITGIGKTPNRRCQHSEDCWNYATATGAGDYRMTHQILYLEFGLMTNCSTIMEDFAVSHNQISVDQLLRTFCSNALREVKDVENKGGPNETREVDLFLEQAFLCGMLGFRDFFTMSRLQKILSEQKPDGCFGFSDKEFTRLKRIYGHPDSWYRQFSKREERLYGEGCLSHTTSVAAGALAQYIRFLVEDPVLSENAS